MQRQANNSLPLSDINRLITKLETIIKEYLIKRFAVDLSVFSKESFTEILNNLRNNPDHYREVSEPVIANNATLWNKAAKQSAHYLDYSVKTISSAVRHYTNNNGLYRLDTLLWMVEIRQGLLDCLQNYGKLLTNIDIEKIQNAIPEMVLSLFENMIRIMETPQTENESFKVTLHGKNFMLSGLKDSKSPFSKLIKMHILSEFNYIELLDNMQSDLAARSEEIRVEIDMMRQIEAAKQAQEIAESKLKELSSQEIEDDEDFAVRLTTQIKSNKAEDRVFPRLEDQTKDGYTSAQLHVIYGRVEFLADTLKAKPSYVDSICRVALKNRFNKRSLVELALFDIKGSSYEDKKTILELILLRRPFITDREFCVLDIILNRLENETPDKRLLSLFCQYAISQKNSLPDACYALQNLLTEIDDLYVKLQNSHLNKFLKELDEPLRYCRLLAKGYLQGDFQAVADALKNEEEVADAEFYEITFNSKQRMAADEKNVNTLRSKLESKLKATLSICYNLKPAGSTASLTANINGPLDLLLRQYSELIDKISRVLTRYGVVLNTKGFNEYQKAELSKFALTYVPRAVLM